MANATATKSAAKGTKPAKAAKPRASTGNLSFEDARAKILKELAKGRKTRTELKGVAPYGNYTGLMAKLEEEGVLKGDKGEEDAYVTYELTSKGRAAAKK